MTAWRRRRRENRRSASHAIVHFSTCKPTAETYVGSHDITPTHAMMEEGSTEVHDSMPHSSTSCCPERKRRTTAMMEEGSSKLNIKFAKHEDNLLD